MACLFRSGTASVRGLSFIAFCNSYIFRKVFSKYEPQEEAEEQGNPDDYTVPEDELLDKQEPLEQIEEKK